MKKIIITTFHRAENYGAMLQAVALYEKLKQMDIEVEFLDYRDFNIENPYCLFPVKNKKGIEWIIAFLRSVRSVNKNIKRKRKFKKFAKQNLKYTDRMYCSEEDVKKFYPKADCYITGSDQVWNPDITGGISDVYTLNFGDENIKRISYAASLGKVEFKEFEQEKLRKNLQYIECISVREQKAKELLKKIVPGKNVQVVLDPTLLLSKEEWEKMLIGKQSVKEPYILAYVVEENEEFRKIVQHLSEKTGYKIVHFERKNYWKNSTSIYTADPLEFIDKIRNAKYVVTTSFHATVFSIIFEKKFWVVPHVTTGDRVLNLLKITGMSKRAVSTYKEFEQNKYDEEISYQAVRTKLNEERIKSIKWLENSIS